MGAQDQKQFTDAVAAAKEGFWGGTVHMFNDDWKKAMDACSRLAMFDMLPALDSLAASDRRFLLTSTPRNPRAPLTPRIVPDSDRINYLGKPAFARIEFAVNVIEHAEIEDFGIPEEQVNDGREFLGCTRMDDVGVRSEINQAIAQGRQRATDPSSCCEAIGIAWTRVLVVKRRSSPTASLIANVAAAAHYMLARYHVCTAQASAWQMKQVIDGYDAQKRIAIATGDRELKSIALTSSRPFPPDFGVRKWGYTGADEGKGDHDRCNADASFPVLIPTVNKKEDGVF